MHLPTFSHCVARKTASLGLALGLTLAAAASQAAVARFDTTSFGYTVSGGTLSWDGNGAYQALATNALAGGGLIDAKTDDSTLFGYANTALTSSTVYANATASASATQTLNGTANATRTSLSANDFPGLHSGNSNAGQYGEFSLSQDGTVTFTIGWQLQVEGAFTDPFSDAASALMTLVAGNYNTDYKIDFAEELFSYDSLTGLSTASGTWTATIALAAGDLGYYDLRGTAHASADSAYVANAVPEPGSLALLAAGLGTLWGVRRRRSAPKA